MPRKRSPEYTWAVELLPVFLDELGSIRVVSPTDSAAWRAMGSGTPHDLVLRELAVFGCGPFVAHSTSWRFEQALTLTYLVLLPTLHPGALPPGFVVRDVTRVEL